MKKISLTTLLSFIGFFSLFSQEGIPVTENKTPDAYSNILFNQGVTYYELKNYKDAFKSFLWCAKSGNDDGQLNLGYLFLNGEGTSKNLTEAFNWFKKSASRNNKMAQYNVGIMLIGGFGTDVNMKEAAIWIKKSYQNGYAQAKEVWESNHLSHYSDYPNLTLKN